MRKEKERYEKYPGAGSSISGMNLMDVSSFLFQKRLFKTPSLLILRIGHIIKAEAHSIIGRLGIMKSKAVVQSVVYIVMSCLFFVLTVLSGYFLYRSGVLRDGLHLTGHEPFYAEAGLWIAMAVAALFLLFSLLVLFITLVRRSGVSLWCLAAVLMAFLYCAVITGLCYSHQRAQYKTMEQAQVPYVQGVGRSA